MPRFARCSGLLLAALFAMLALPRFGWGQNVYGTIAGTVTDPTGAAVPEANVTLTSTDTGETHTVKTDSSGNYTFVNVRPGNYKVEGEKAGFKKYAREGIVVEVESGLRVDFSLQVGESTQTVEVTAETPLLQPETNSLGQVVESRPVVELPLNGRNPLALIALSAGVVPQGQPSSGNSSMGSPVGANPFALGDFQIGGGQAGQSQILIDGVPTNGAYLNVVTVVPTQDAVQEFKVQTNNLGPEYGRFAGGVINLSTKSGTNQFHGSLYEFLRNKVLNANNFFANQAGNPRPPFTQNQFGVNVGGPVIKDKLFFFSSYEGFRLRQGEVFDGWVPTQLERSGNFSQVGSTANPIPLQLYDPLTSSNCTSTATSCRQLLNGGTNIIPASRLDPTAVALLSYFPLPNQVNNPSGNYAESYSAGGNTDEINERIDYNMSESQRLFGRYTRSSILSLPDAVFPQICNDRCTETTVTNQFVIGDTYSISPTTILDLHVGYTRYVYLRTPLSQGIDLSKFGPNWKALTPEMTYTHIPTVCINSGGRSYGGGSWCGQGTGSGIGAHDDTISFMPNISKILGNHNLKIGGEYRILRNNYYQSNDPAGFLNFDANMTSANPNNSCLGSAGNYLSSAPSGCPVQSNGQPYQAGGNGFASFLLGYGSGGSVTEPARTADQNLYSAVYFGDTWQATHNLTINIGARVDMQGDWTERYNRIVVFNPSEISPIANQVGMPNLKGAYDLVDSSRHSSRTAFPSWNHISPRIGLSYALGQKTVIRTGYGMFYLPVDVRWNDAPHNLFINSFSTPWLTAQSDGVTPRNPLYDPFPQGITPPFGRNQALIDVQGNGNEAPLPYNPAPYVQQWNFDVQQQFPGNTLLDVAYAGSKGTHLPMHDQGLDALAPQFWPHSQADVANLNQQVTNPFYGVMQSGGVGSNPTVKLAQLLLPYPQFDGVAMAEPDNRDSSYNSLQTKLEKRFSGGAQILATYTLAKLIDNTNSEINWLEAASPSWGDFNPYNLRAERSLDGFDVKNRFVLATVLDLPFGHGKKFASNLGPVANKFIGGWGVDTIVTFQSGFPINIGGCPGPLSNSGIVGAPCARPIRTALSHLTSGTLDQKLAHWFDTSVFQNTLDPGDPNYWGVGNDSRTEPNIRSDGVKNFDIAAFKKTTFGPNEGIDTEFRAEFFNAFNRVQFDPPNTGCCTSSSFGQVTGQYNLPRVIQFALRVTF